MKIEIEIDENEIAELVKEKIVDELVSNVRHSFDRRLLEKTYREYVKEVVYDPAVKKACIERATSQAAHEIKAKGMKQLLGKIMEESE